MKFSTIIVGAIFAMTASAAAAPNPVVQVTKTTVTEVQTVTKYKPTTVTATEIVTKGKTIYTTVFATVTEFRTKTKKVCPTSASATASVYGRDLSGMKARAAGEQPLYAKEFA